MTTHASTPKTTVVSAPGKVLLAGGYLVLDPAYSGLVIATDSRFYTVIQDLGRESDSSSDSDDSSITMIVESPQFIGAKWVYKVKESSRGDWKVDQSKETFSSTQAGKNPFLSLSILYTFKLISELKTSSHLSSRFSSKSFKVTIVGDNDFYSQRAHDPAQESSKSAPAPTTSYLKSLKPFESQPCSIKDVHKTGLGSSAAMTTSLIGSLMLHFGGISASSPSGTTSSSHQKSIIAERDLALVHNLAQLAHCAAQGKIGSGFDISSAVWGSQLYRRFEPEVLKPLLEEGLQVGVEGQDEGEAEPSTSNLKLLPFLDPSNPQWHPSPLSSSTKTTPTAVEGLASISSSNDSSLKIPRPAPIELPPFIKLVLADVDTGSNTPSLVSKVNQWKKEKPEWCSQLFHILSISNQSLTDHLLALSLAHLENPSSYRNVLREFQNCKSGQWKTHQRTEHQDHQEKQALGRGQGQGQEEEEKEKRRRNQRKSEMEIEIEIQELLIELRNSLRSIRAGMRELGQRSKAEIEPDSMGKILKSCIENSNGIIGGGVPGAGGFDALYLLYLNVGEEGEEEAEEEGMENQKVKEDRVDENRLQVEEIWKNYKELSVGPLLSQAGGSIASSTSSSSPSTSTSTFTISKGPGQGKGDQKETLGLQDQIDKVMRLNEKRKSRRGIQEKAGLCIEELEKVKGLKEAVERKRR